MPFGFARWKRSRRRRWPLTIVDWDNPVFARKERDLMFVGAVWAAYGPIPARPNGSSADGPADIDLTAIAFYRYERIVVDIAEYGQRIFDPEGRTEDRQRSLRKLASGFKPNNVLDMAHRSYRALG